MVAFLNAALGSAAPNRFTDHETRATDAVGFVARLSLAPDWESEGRAIAAALLQLRKELPSLQWSEVRILLRARTHFQSYELALTEAGIPFVSDRSGGLLSSPEIEDLIALLRFLAAPWSDRDCAQALKSPIFGLADSQLVAIAKQRAADDAESFYAGLLACGLQPDADPALAAAVESLSRWIDLSTQLPVHDLLDQILHDQDVFDRIASRTPIFVACSGSPILKPLLALLWSWIQDGCPACQDFCVSYTDLLRSLIRSPPAPVSYRISRRWPSRLCMRPRALRPGLWCLRG